MTAKVVSITVAVWSILHGHQGVHDLVAGKILRGEAEMGTQHPFIIIHLTGGNHNYTLTGPSDLRRSNVRLELFADDVDTLDLMEAEILDALNAYRGTIDDVVVQGAFCEGTSDDSDLAVRGGDDKVFRRFMDWQINYAGA